KTVAFQLERQRGGIAVDHVNTPIGCKLPFQRARERRVEFEQEQMRISCHPSRNRTRVHALARAVFRDHPWLGEIHFASDAFHQRPRAWHNRRDLEWALQETLEKQCAHKSSDVRLSRSCCLVSI